MKVCVSGGSGYIGSALVVHLLAKGHQVRVFETQIFGNPIAHLEGPNCEFVIGDIRDLKAVSAACEGMDAVTHLAGVVTDELVDLNESFSEDVNIGGTQNIVDACRKHDVRRLLYASSSSVYGTAAEGDIPPDEQVTPLPKTAYAKQKLAGEEICLAYGDDHHVATAVRQATAMGPSPRWRADTVVNTFSLQAYFNKLITPYGGEQYRSNVYVGDAARFYEGLLVYEGGKINKRVWNLTDENLKVIEIARRVQEVAKQQDIEAEIKIVDIEDNRSYRLDGSAVTRELGFTNATGLYAAVQRNFEFFAKTDLDPTDEIYYNNKKMGPMLRGKNDSA